MESIVFEEELVKEEVYEGTFIIDEKLTPNQQKRKIFNMMKKDGVFVENESEYHIQYEGVEDNDGLSETQETKFVVTRIYNKKIPYRVIRDEVYQGTYILDGLRISPEEQRRKIFDMMRDEGYSVENEDEYEITFEGVDDNEGLSETQVSHFIVTRVRKEKLTEEEYQAIKFDDSNEAKDLYDEMLKLKEEVLSTNDEEKMAALSSKIEEVTGKVDTIVEKSMQNYGIFEDQLKEVDKEVKELEEQLKDQIRAYELSYESIKSLMESKEVSEDLETKKEEENAKALEIRTEIEKLKKELSKAKAKRTKIKKDYDTAKALGLSAEEYQELTSNLRKKDILNAILEKKGLGEILAISPRDRTPGQKKTISDAKKEIMEEIAKLQRENERQSVLSSIEALYGLELQKVRQRGKQKVIIVKKENLENMKENAQKLPEKIIKKQDVNIDYKPGEVPEDLKGVFDSIKQDEELRGVFIPGEENIRDVILRDHGIDIEEDDTYEIGYEGVSDNNGISETQSTEYVLRKKKDIEQPEEEIEIPEVEEQEERKDVKELFTLFHDPSDDRRIYVRKPVLERFYLEPIGEEVRIEGTASYEIREDDAKYIEDNANNNYSPYIVEHRTSEIIREEKLEEERKDVKELFTLFHDPSDDRRIYVRKPVLERFYLEPIGEEVRIEGTASYEIREDDAKYIEDNANNNYSPYIVEHRTSEIIREEKLEEERKDVKEKFTIFHDPNDESKLYARKPLFERFYLEPIGEEVRIEGTASYGINPEDAKYIEQNANNNYSPYIVEHKTKEILRNPSKENEEQEERKDAKEKFTIFHDEEDESKLYARKPVFERFHIEPQTDEVRIEGTTSYGISKDDAEYIERNANNNYSPYVVEHKTAKIVSKETKDERTISKGATEKITLFKDNNGKLYLRKPAFERFHLEPIGDELRIEGVVSYEVSKEDAEYIINNAKNNYSPYIVSHVDVLIDESNKEANVSLDRVMDKVKPEPRRDDSPKYTPNNVEASKEFKEDLRNGETKYNISSKVPGPKRASYETLDRLGRKIEESKVGEEIRKEISHNMDSLSEDEIKALMKDFKNKERITPQMRRVMEPKIKELIVLSLRSINKGLANKYGVLTNILKELKEIEEKSQNLSNSNDEIARMEELRVINIRNASKIIQDIMDLEENAKNLLTWDDKTIEFAIRKDTEDLRYVGKEDINSLDGEYQVRFLNFDKALKTSVINHNDEGIVQNFLGRKSCFEKDEKVKGKIVGRRSIGTTYYPMLSKESPSRKEEEISRMMEDMGNSSKESEDVKSYAK